MRYAILGDIHANQEALEAVLHDSSLEGCEEYACIGDIVGLGASPRECIDRIRDLDCSTVKGDSDEISSEISPLDGLNPILKRMICWTRDQLSSDDKKWLRGLTLVSEIRGFTIVHATLDSPSSWAYVVNEFDAMASFSYQHTNLCFFGHTHCPKFYMKDDCVSSEAGDRIDLRESTKYFINVGSVGQPRDGDPRACYAIYDTEQAWVRIKRVDYDSGLAQRKLIDSGLPPLIRSEQASDGQA
ncbi:MAG: metallophosphoesterase family protein [Verrucomicrobiales bacterium]|jgi:diadenosine tetraphosphatase ApaH/serine/threonine PP2A family protein phosphatase|nr:metallophosphoesterase family protein [Verrucomicrobiales bacterium]